tara:strand:+ start:647 stop:868 length:222 start_codon:yes stop_codon:yes gene_type:complete
MAFQRQSDVGARHSGPVVGHLHQIESTLLQADIDLAGPGVDRIFYELLEGTGRAFDDLTGSYPIYKAVWESSY